MANPEWKLRIGSCNGPQKIHRFDPHLRPCKSRRSWRTINCYKIADTWWFSEFLIFFFYFKSGWIEIEWTQNPWSWTVIDLWWSQGYCYIIQCILNNICTVLRNLNFYFWHFFLNSSYTFFVKSLVGVCSDGPGVHVSANCSDRERSTNISHIANCEDAYESSSFLKRWIWKEMKENKETS